VPERELAPTVLQWAASVVPPLREPERQGAVMLPWQRPERQAVEPWEEL
jgi:hypothetical protein